MEFIDPNSVRIDTHVQKSIGGYHEILIKKNMIRKVGRRREKEKDREREGGNRVNGRESKREQKLEFC